jgi:hypothetical protein
MDGNPVALVDPWGDKADGDGPDGNYNSGKQSGSGTANDPYYEHGNITEGSFLLDDVVVVPPTADTPANKSFVPISTMVFNDIIDLQQNVNQFDPIQVEVPKGGDDFDINGYAYRTKEGKGNEKDNFWNDGTSDHIFDLTNIDDIVGSQSAGLSKVLSFLNSFFGFIKESGVLKKIDSALRHDVDEKTDNADPKKVNDILRRFDDEVAKGKGRFKNWSRIDNGGHSNIFEWFQDATGDSVMRVVNGDTTDIYLPIRVNGSMNGRSRMRMEDFKKIDEK